MLGCLKPFGWGPFPTEAASYVARRHLGVRRRGGDMFRIQQDLLDASIFLYPDESSAAAGEQVGGSGFLLGWAMPRDVGGFSLWAVTNRHVIEQGHWTIRLNLKDGGLCFVDTDDTQWIFHPDSDLAVRPMQLSQGVQRFKFVTDDWLLKEEWQRNLDIGPGDPCFTIGRFVGHDGRQQNNPTVRFGQIAQTNTEPVVIDGKPQSCFLVESRSIGGFSGSPVFVYLDTAYYRPSVKGLGPDGKQLYQGVFPMGPWLLGINFAMIPLWEDVRDASGQSLGQGMRVPMNTGVMGVVPAAHLIDLMSDGPAAAFHEAIAAEARRLSSTNLPNALPTGGAPSRA